MDKDPSERVQGRGSDVEICPVHWDGATEGN